jgi:hypothetical protein
VVVKIDTVPPKNPKRKRTMLNVLTITPADKKDLTFTDLNFRFKRLENAKGENVRQIHLVHWSGFKPEEIGLTVRYCQMFKVELAVSESEYEKASKILKDNNFKIELRQTPAQ